MREYGLIVIRQKKSHTSKTSYLDRENPDHKPDGDYEGKRNGRQFKTKSGIKLHSDVNGAAQIGVKYMLEELKIPYDYDLPSRKLDHPTRLKVW
jgi:hypothetical protein